MKRTGQFTYAFLFFTSILLLTLLLGSCDLLNTKESSSSGNLTGSVITNDTGEGVSNALIRVFDADSLTATEFTDENGKFSFQNLEPGEKTVRLSLPTGFLFVDDPEKTINIDGNVNIDFLAEPVREITKTITPGSIDTLATSSGAFIEVDASSSTRSIDVSIEEIELSGDESDFDTKPVRISIRLEGQAKKVNGEYGFNRTANFVGISLGIKVWKHFKGTASEDAIFAYNVSTDSEPIYLYADTEKTTYRDPNTGEVVTVSLHEFQVSDTEIDVVMRAAIGDLNDRCGRDRHEGLRKLEPIPRNQAGNQALIFVHGWQPTKVFCRRFENFDPETEVFMDLITLLERVPEIRSNYNFYIYRYPTNAHILAASEDLYSRIQELELEKPIVIGHSMGGLVGRGLLAAYGQNELSALITLGTPHRGSELADDGWILNSIDVIGGAVICSKFPLLCGLRAIGGSIFPTTNGLNDLSTNSDFIQNLKASEFQNSKVYSIAGNVNSGTDDLRITYDFGSFLFSQFGIQSDGIVPRESAIPEWSLMQTLLSSHDHTKIKETSDVAEQIIPILKVLSECVAPPSRVERNDFNLSGSVGRENDRVVRVTLNAISVDGTIATDLGKENFIVIENDCVRNITDFSSENVGVDIVFVQDLSGSMGGAIAGVRSSVINFANDLARKGINAQFASIGYSGPGNIPTTPPTSPCEFLGPFQDLKDVNTFQAHVTGSWRATGGCDLPENGLEAIQYAHENVSWRSGAARVYIDITDVSHHTADTNCNGLGPCTDQTLESIVDMVGETSIIHVVAPQSEFQRTRNGGLDPWKLAEATGGEKLVLPSNGFVDLTALGIAEVVGEAITFTFESASPQQAIHSLRIRAEINGKVAELAPNLVRYKPIDLQLSQIK